MNEKLRKLKTSIYNYLDLIHKENIDFSNLNQTKYSLGDSGLLEAIKDEMTCTFLIKSKSIKYK